jgi:hypothetical protein
VASEVDICNLALGHLGDNATVASLDPPEGSAQAEHCARFYPMARDALLELHDWNFATRRAQLALVGSAWTEWLYAYAQPSDCLNVIAVMSPDANDDYSSQLNMGFSQVGSVNNGQGIYTPQPYVCEIDDQGRQVVYTNQQNAVLRYVAYVTDTTKFSPLFTETLSWRVASLLAGPIIKGDAGRAEAKRCAGMAEAVMIRATESDAAQRRVTPRQSVNWMVNR